MREDKLGAEDDPSMGSAIPNRAQLRVGQAQLCWP